MMRCTCCGHENPEGQRFCGECGTRLEPESTAPESVGAGRYRLERPLGEGSRKRVYLGRDIRLDREVAVAVVKTEGLDDTGRHRITREARAMARLGDHPHIVTVFDVGEDDGTPYIVAELMPGGSVADVLDSRPDGRLPVDEALAIAEQVALALEHAHGLTIVHRDLKPANVWLAADGTARLGDFGLAVDVNVSRMTSEGMVVGTVAYLAPEQAVGRAPEPRSDLYALGAMLYELLTGRPPFLGDDAVSVISQHLNTAPVSPSWHNADVPRAVEALVLRLLEKDPAARPASATEVVAEIRRLRARTPEPVVGPTAHEDAARASSIPFGRLVGRTGELAQLTGAFDEAAAGRGRLLLVAGEPGIGKTRLTEELATYAGVRGAKTCWGHCYEGELGVPYLPFVEALRTYTRARPDDALRVELGAGAPEMALLVSELRERFPDLPTAPSLDGDAERLRLFEGVATFLHNAAAEQTIVLMLDDLHWADKPTLLLVQYLARNLRRDRVLMVGTYRDVELDRAHPLAEAIASLRREQLFERVLLRGLPAEEVHAFIEAFGEQEPPPEFSATIYRETEGNPFFLTEILRHLVESGALTRVDGRWVGDPASFADALPEGVREVIGRRLDHLSDECNRMLTVGAAMPGGFEMEVCATVLDLDEDRVLDLLDEALDRQIVRERSGAAGIYEFSHALIRQTLYGELSTPRRVRLHRQIATALEARYGANIDAHLGEVAYHCFQGAPGGDIDKAVDYATRAAERASAQAGHEEAARYYEMALQAFELADDVDDGRRAELQLVLGTARGRAGDTDAADAALREAAALARLLEDGPLFARIALASASLTVIGTLVRADLAGLATEALERLGDRDLALRARLLSVLAQLSFFYDIDRYRALEAEAVVLARRSGDPRALSQALLASLWSLGGPESAEQRRAIWDEITELNTRIGETGALFSVLISRLTYALKGGERDEYDSQRAIYVRLAEESRSPFRMASAITEQGVASFLDGDLDAAEQRLFEALEMGRRIRDPAVTQNVGIALFPVWRERGRLASLVEATRQTVEGPSALDSWRIGLAHMLEQTGDLDGAAQMLDVVAEDGFARLPDDLALPYTLCAAAEVAVALRDMARCTQLYDHLLPLAGSAATIGSAAYHGAADRYLGLIALALGRPNDAVAHLEAAVAIHERMRARPWLARTQYDLGRALLARATPADSERALALLNEALATANAVGMARLVDETLAAKLALQGISSGTIMASIDIVAAAVKADRPNLRSQSGADGMVTILFSDIERYTEMTERLGDTRSQVVLRAHNAILRREVVTHRGNEVKSAGDGFMLAFADVVDALACAVAIQRAIAASDIGGERIRVRMGLHTGAVIREDDDLFGRTVIVAARVAALARGGEVLGTEEVRAATKADDSAWGPSRETALKGLAGTHQVFAARW
jgi:class 3 adenylate cyclase/tetratricopeptide (TPR) repeat protein